MRKFALATNILLLTIISAASALCWTTPAPVAWTGEDSLDPTITVDGSGKVHTAWRERTGGSKFHIWYVNDISGVYSSPAEICIPGTDQCYSPVLAANGNDIHVVWSRDYEAYYRKMSGGVWGTIINASNTSIKSLRPRIAVRGGVGPVVSFDEAIYADDNYDVYFTEWNGSGFSAPINLSQTAGGAVYGSVNSNVAISPNGDVTVVWIDRITGDYHPNARRRVGGVWQPRQEISSIQLGPATPGIAAGPDNRVHVVYASNNRIYHQEWNGYGWTAPVILPDVPGNELRAKCAVDGNGYVHVVCDNSSYGSGDIYYTNNTAGYWVGWVNISNTENTNSISADISFNANVLAIAWQDNSNGAGGTGVFNTWCAKTNIYAGPTGTLVGCVRDQFGAIVPGATVSSSVYSTQTNSNGQYSLTLPTGSHSVTAAKPYYSSQTIEGINIQTGITTNLDLSISAIPPGPPLSFIAVGSDGINRLSWINSSSGNFHGVVIRYSTSGFPTSVVDGQFLCNVLGSPGAEGSYDHTGVTNGTVYYYTAFSYDADNHYSSGVNASAEPKQITCGYAKTLVDGIPVDLKSKVVTAVFLDEPCVYVSEPDSSSGIRVAYSTSGLGVGDVVDVSGQLSTRRPDGVTASEREVSSATVNKLYSGPGVEPLAMKCLSVGGSRFGDYAPGVVGGVGLNNIGSLVKIAGRVTLVISNYIYVDDGSNVADISGRVGVFVRCASTPDSTWDDNGTTVSVTGVVEGSIPVGWSENRRYIRCRVPSDIQVIQPGP